MRATVADIANKADVSTATVDRVLHARAGVSAANRHRVMKAARELGYFPMDGVTALPSRPTRIAFLIPFGKSVFMQDVSDSIQKVADSQPLVESCAIIALTGIGADALSVGLDQLPNDVDGIGVITTDHPKTRESLRRISEAGIRIVTIASDVQATPRSAYVGVDNYIAGRTAGQILSMAMGTRTGKVAVFYGSRAFIGHHERDSGFRAFMKETCADTTILSCIETGENGERLYDQMSRLLRTEPELCGVYCVGAGRSGLVEALEWCGRKERPAVVMHDLTQNSGLWLKEGRIDAVIDQNASLVGERAVLQLLAAIASTSEQPALHHIEPRIIVRENIPVR